MSNFPFCSQSTATGVSSYTNSTEKITYHGSRGFFDSSSFGPTSTTNGIVLAGRQYLFGTIMLEEEVLNAGGMSTNAGMFGWSQTYVNMTGGLSGGYYQSDTTYASNFVRGYFVKRPIDAGVTVTSVDLYNLPLNSAAPVLIFDVIEYLPSTNTYTIISSSTMSITAPASGNKTIAVVTQPIPGGFIGDGIRYFGFAIRATGSNGTQYFSSIININTL